MNRQVILSSRPVGIPQAGHFRLIETPSPPPPPNGFVVRNRFLSVEPAMRGWVADHGNYSQPVEIGAVMRSLAVGEVVATETDEYKVGDVLTGWFGWQEFAGATSTDVVRRVTETGLPISLSLGILGINGVTALLALSSIGQPIAGETVVVSTAAGSVGSAAGQIARIMGCRTVGVTGGRAKVANCVDVFGYDAAIDYKEEDLSLALRAACPSGVDVFFDNTAGRISDAVLPHLNVGARIVVCGTAAHPSWDPWPMGPRVERHLLVKRARMQGFVVFDHMKEWDAAIRQLATWVKSGDLRYIEDVLDGIEACPDAIAGLYRGENLGKRVIRLP